MADLPQSPCKNIDTKKLNFFLTHRPINDLVKGQRDIDFFHRFFYISKRSYSSYYKILVKIDSKKLFFPAEIYMEAALRTPLIFLHLTWGSGVPHAIPSVPQAL